MARRSAEQLARLVDDFIDGRNYGKRSIALNAVSGAGDYEVGAVRR